jgi:hypothetical protein
MHAVCTPHLRWVHPWLLIRHSQKWLCFATYTDDYATLESRFLTCRLHVTKMTITLTDVLDEINAQLPFLESGSHSCCRLLNIAATKHAFLLGSCQFQA